MVTRPGFPDSARVRAGRSLPLASFLYSLASGIIRTLRVNPWQPVTKPPWPSCCENAAWLSNGSRTGLDRRSGLERRLQPAPRPQAANGITLVGFKGFKRGCRFSCRRGGREDTRMSVSPGGSLGAQGGFTTGC